MPPNPFVFFDAAGTLFRLSMPVGAGYSRVAATFGFELDPDRADRAFRDTFSSMNPPDYLNSPARTGRSTNEAVDREWWRSLVAEVFRRCGADPSARRFPDCFTALFDYYGTVDAWQAFPDAIPALERLQQAGVPLGILSNFDARLYGILRGLGMLPFFEPERIAVSSELGSVKPQLRTYTAAAALAKSAPADCVLIGDDPERDHRAALQAGFGAAFLVHRPETSLLTVTHQILNLRLRAQDFCPNSPAPPSHPPKARIAQR